MDKYLLQFGGDDNLDMNEWAAYELSRRLPDNVDLYGDYVNAQWALKLLIGWFAENVPGWQNIPEVQIAIGEAAHLPRKREIRDVSP